MGLFDGVIGGFIGGELATVVNRLLEQQGGLTGLVSKLEQNGLGPVVQSWVGTGANAPVSPSQLHQALGSDLVQQLAARTGLSTDDLVHRLSQVLPTVVDKMTPDGTLPKA